MGPSYEAMLGTHVQIQMQSPIKWGKREKPNGKKPSPEREMMKAYNALNDEWEEQKICPPNKREEETMKPPPQCRIFCKDGSMMMTKIPPHKEEREPMLHQKCQSVTKPSTMSMTMNHSLQQNEDRTWRQPVVSIIRILKNTSTIQVSWEPCTNVYNLSLNWRHAPSLTRYS